MDIVHDHESSSTELPSPPGRWWASDRAALTTFVVLIVGAFPLILLYLGNQRWFYLDEWDFLVTRQGNNIDDLVRPHNEHPSTLPVLVYKALWPVFGLRTYVPYQAVLVTLHLIAVVLLRVVMRRSGVSAWVATITAAALILFGAGSADIIRAFGMTFVGSLVFGLTQLLLVDHEGRWDRRDWLALGAGVAALLCSGVGVTMVVVVGVAALIRRGWKVAFAQTVPLAVMYLVWSAIESPDSGTGAGHGGPLHIVGQMSRFVVHGFLSTFRGLGHYRPVGALLAVVLIAGWVIGSRRQGVVGFVRRASGPFALAVGSVVMLTLSGWVRWPLGPQYAAQSRYLYLVAALLLPALAVAIDSIGERWRLAAPIALAALLIGVPGNVRLFRSGDGSADLASQRQVLLSIATSPLAGQVPPDLRPEMLTAHEVTVGWLLEQARAGKVPGPGAVSEPIRGQVLARLGLQQVFYPYSPVDCQATTTGVDVSPDKGDRIVLDGDLADISVRDGDGWSSPTRYNLANLHLFEAQLPGLTFKIEPAGSSGTVLICR